MSKQILSQLKSIYNTVNGITKQQIKDSYKIYREGRSVIYIKKGAKDITVWYSPHNTFIDEFADEKYQEYAQKMFNKIEIGYIKMFLQRNNVNLFDVNENGQYILKKKTRFIVCINVHENDLANKKKGGITNEIKRGFLFRQNGEIRVKTMNLMGQTFKEPTLKSRVGDITPIEKKAVTELIEIIEEYLNRFSAGKIKPLIEDTQDIAPPDIESEVEEDEYVDEVDKIIQEELAKDPVGSDTSIPADTAVTPNSTTTIDPDGDE